MIALFYLKWLVTLLVAALATRRIAGLVAAQPGTASSTERDWLRATRMERLAVFVLLVLVMGAIFAPLLTLHAPDHPIDPVAMRGVTPSLALPFGTDDLSRDVFSRTMFGARVSLSVAFMSVLIALVVGSAWGIVSALSGGVVDSIMMRTVDALMAVPRILVLIVIVALFGELSTFALIAILGSTGWYAMSRIVRSEVRVLRTHEYVVAADALGTRTTGLIWRHLLPNLFSPVAATATVALGEVIVVEAGLSFLGYGVQIPHASWGNVIGEAQANMQLWWISVFPGLAIVAAVMSVNALADGLREAHAPRQLVSDSATP